LGCFGNSINPKYIKNFMNVNFFSQGNLIYLQWKEIRKCWKTHNWIFQSPKPIDHNKSNNFIWRIRMCFIRRLNAKFTSFINNDKLLEWEQCKLLAYYSKRKIREEKWEKWGNKFSGSCLWVYFKFNIFLFLKKMS
jgi:hypothetical protein